MSIETFHYEGPIQLGSIVGHNCSAAGLFSIKEGKAHIQCVGREEKTQIFLTVYDVDGEEIGQWSSDNTVQGRQDLGRILLRFLMDYTKQPLSEWGDLVGVRPTKFYRHKLQQGYTVSDLREYLQEERSLTKEKADLLEHIVSIQEPIIAQENKNNISLYGGIPFCTSHCSYCSFPYGLIHQFEDMKGFVRTYLANIDHVKQCIENYNIEVLSAYMGGGTPTSLSEEDFETLVGAFSKLVPEGIEFTVEAGRPDTVTAAKLETMKRHHVTRISINPQTMDDEILRHIGRQHSAKEIDLLYDTVRRETEFSINMDFIAGLPKQAMSHMVENMDYVCQKRPENVTIHTLALKKGSPLYTRWRDEKIPSQEEVKAMISYCHDTLIEAGYEPYYLYKQQYMRGSFENIGYALPGTACAYNIHMMEEQQSIISVGPGTTSKWMCAPSYRQKKMYIPKDVQTYIDNHEGLFEKMTALCHAFYREE